MHILHTNNPKLTIKMDKVEGSNSRHLASIRNQLATHDTMNRRGVKFATAIHVTQPKNNFWAAQESKEEER